MKWYVILTVSEQGGRLMQLPHIPLMSVTVVPVKHCAMKTHGGVEYSSIILDLGTRCT
jgi:hypothetical protein